MNTEPPSGDELAQMLVAMKQTVLTRAAEVRPQRRRRGRRTGIVIGVIAVLGFGATGGGVALGMIPQPFAAAPAPTAAPTRTQSPAPSTPAAAPVQETPEPTPTPTSTRRPFALDDPATWTISGDEVGPIALGGATTAESDDLERAYRLLPATPASCTAPGTWAGDGSPTLLLADEGGRVAGVLVGAENGAVWTTTTGPTTVEGIGVGSTSEALHAAYPSLQASTPTPTGAWSRWDLRLPDGLVSFQLGSDGTHVDSVWVSADQNLPTAICDI